MDAVCQHSDGLCQAFALAAALHSLNLYCASISTALICCCSTQRPRWCGIKWQWQNTRGIVSLTLGVVWCCVAASGSLRPGHTMRLVASLMAPLSWLAAAAMHITLWTRRSTAPILYLAIYWLLSSASSATITYRFLLVGVPHNHVEVYLHGVGIFLAFIMSGVDWLCFYDEVTKRSNCRIKSSTESKNTLYLYNDTHFYSKITFFWLNTFLYKGYRLHLDNEDLKEVPEDETAKKHFKKFKAIINKGNTVSIWKCYVRMVWPNFYIAGILRLFSDLSSVIPALGLATLILYMENETKIDNVAPEVTVQEFFSNGYVVLVILTLALIIQALLSQNSTHLLMVEGSRLKMALQSMIYDKCTRLACWSTDADVSEESPLLHNPEDDANTQSGLLMNLISQDTYNIMSCVWVFHYTWAIPLKVIVILYLLYTKLGYSAIIGSVTSLCLITPLQLFIGKKISDNSRDISKCTDHRISKISEILQGMNVIKLYVWEDLFNEKILQLREVELKLLNKDSWYWGLLNFTTQVSAALITIITFTTHYYLENTNTLNSINVFAGLALFNQLTIPLLILPVTLFMIIQAMVSTKRIKDFLELPESCNTRDGTNDNSYTKQSADNVYEAFLDVIPEDNLFSEREEFDLNNDNEHSGFSSAPIVQGQEYLIRFTNAAFSWKMKDNVWLEIDNLDIPSGKLIMVVGASGSGKSLLLSAILGEMYQERGDVNVNVHCSTWYAGQPPWLLEGSIRDNILMDSAWCPKRYARVLRATGLRPDLQLLPDGDDTQLGSYGTPLSGGQRVRLCVARALYSKARLIVLDEPLSALDVTLAQHLVARALIPAARSGRTVILATHRLEVLHYADFIIAMGDGRVNEVGRLNTMSEGVISQWARLAADARAAALRTGAGPTGGAARERKQLVRAISRLQFQRNMSDDAKHVGINEVVGAHLLTEVPTCAGGSWRQIAKRARPPISRQFSSPSPTDQNFKWYRDLRRAVSADESNEVLQHEASLLRRFLSRRPYHTISRWTPRILLRILSSDSDTSTHSTQNNVVEEPSDEATFNSTTCNGIETYTAQEDMPEPNIEDEHILDESKVWWKYSQTCRWWGAAYCVVAVAAQAVALASDYWLSHLATENARSLLSDQEIWNMIRVYALWCVGAICAAGCAQVACACAGAASRRTLHERLLHATLHAPLHYHNSRSAGDTIHRFSSDTLVVDKKLPTAVNRWVHLALLCGAAILVNVIASPWTLLAIIPACAMYIVLQSVYLKNARTLQHAEAESAARAVSLAAQTLSGAVTVRAGCLRPRMRDAFCRRLDRNHNALLLLNSANRWLSLTLDVMGACSVFVSLAAALYSGIGGAATGLAGTYSLLLPAYLAHLGKGRADLDTLLASVQRLLTDTDVPQENYREDCPIPTDWQRSGKIEFQDVTIQHHPESAPVLQNVNIVVNPGQRIAICGRSGSGKSSLLLTCAGATTIHSGRVLLDGQDITHVPLRVLRHRVVVLPQETVMFSGTLRENLDPLAVHTDEEIWQSLRAVGLFDYVTAQPAGLECSVCGARGWGGGRGARVCAARAALHARPAAALLLDEPGAALDATAERALLNAIAIVAPNATILTVAHRISSVRDYDGAMLLERGAASECADMDSLLSPRASLNARSNGSTEPGHSG
ncbi:ATP-binding cassette sub-family C member Sur-like isoform X2 [Nymphalis io]|uniref:ATP-binding cassette sub-family C member Sur-like isoform X2 n=1 Tax=Inachis io TaxID=171585 RepID=UPI00216AB046|nr:ATP-binding cassette sub-family C member Sur-like isoform X2 [Nymphalis io]